jgi:two-component system, NarL family, sensor histidine kinase ComP
MRKKMIFLWKHTKEGRKWTMWKRNIMRAVVIFFVIYQIWALFIVFRYPLIGINLEQDNSGNWIISSIDEANIVNNTGIQAGDRIISINGSDPDAYRFVQLWRTVDQADEFVVNRDGVLLEVRVRDLPLLSVYDTISFLAEFFSLLLAVIIYKRVRNSPSAVYLSAVFLDIAFIFMSLATSIRGDSSGKFLITFFMMLMPALFLHFFNAFLQEKGSYGFPNSLVRGYLYVIALPVVLNALTFFTTMHTVELYFFHTGHQRIGCYRLSGASDPLLC